MNRQRPTLRWQAIPAWMTAAITLLACAESANPIAAAATKDTSSDVVFECIGPVVPAMAWQAQAGPIAAQGAKAPTPVVGDAAPDFELPDIQPYSCGYKATYGLKAFAGRPTVVALLAGW